MSSIINQIEINQPPFEPTDIEAVAITNIGLMFGIMVILFFMMILMIYMYKVIKDIIPIITVWSFSMIFGFQSFECILPINPYCSIFFLIFQTVFLYLSAMDYIETSKNKKLGK